MGAEAPGLDGPRLTRRQQPPPPSPSAASARTQPNGTGRSPWLLPTPEDRMSELDEDVDLFQLELGPPTLNLTAEPDKIADDEDEAASDSTEQSEYEVYDEIPADESMHTAGVPRSDRKLDARHYKTAHFGKELLELLCREIKIPIWADLPADFDPSVLSIHKVSGALTNAVFFINIPPEVPVGTRRPPTILLRIYGAASGSLISRQGELHILHTLSSVYNIGPRVLGTFGNGRAEEYFDSQALSKEQMRDPTISRWIARRMRELHSVNASLMTPPKIVDGPVAPDRLPPMSPGLRPKLSARNSSTTSVVSNGSVSSAFSFESCYSASTASTASLTRRGSSIPPSPYLGPSSFSSRSGLSESRSVDKKRSLASIRSALSSSVDNARRSNSLDKHRHESADRKQHKHESLGAWSNLVLWTREVQRIFKVIDRLKTRYSAGPRIDASSPTPLNPLSSPAALLAWRNALDLPAFEKEVKRYRQWVGDWERKNGRSRRVFAHNDTQYGNLLLRTRDGEPDPIAIMTEEHLRMPHELLIVVDFEYASLNARAFDIANHLLEWRADYHSTDSWSLETHLSPPNRLDRFRFYRAYVGVDDGINGDEDDDAPVLPNHEDARVLRLENEVRVWTPASHAMWAMWGCVNARDEIMAKVETWLGTANPLASTVTVQGDASTSTPILRPGLEDRKIIHNGNKEEKTPDSKSRPVVERGKSGEFVGGDVDEAEAAAAEGAPVEVHDFSYCLYALSVRRSFSQGTDVEQRIGLFRQELAALNIDDE